MPPELALDRKAALIAEEIAGTRSFGLMHGSEITTWDGTFSAFTVDPSEWLAYLYGPRTFQDRMPFHRIR
jgi:hypothetical protein